MKHLLLVDMGGSSLKAGLYRADGVMVAFTRIPNNFDEDETGRCEQNPEDWWHALQEATNVLKTQAENGLVNVVAIVICGFTRTQVFLNADGTPVRPAMIFRDSRAACTIQDQKVQQLLAHPDARRHHGARYFNSFHPLARFLWLRQHESTSWQKMAHVIEPKDYLNFKLTGVICSDPVSQFWLLDAFSVQELSEPSSQSLGQLLSLGADNLLPPLCQPHECIGHVQAGLAGALGSLQGAKVFCGGPDTWTAAFGLEAVKAGCAYGISGSSEVFGIISPVPVEAKGLITIPWAQDLWQIGGPGQNGANILSWMVQYLDRTSCSFDEKLGRLLALQSYQPLLFHPYLYGERTPFWDRDLRACMLGLNATHQPGDQLRAVMEGVAFVNRMVLERAEAASGHHVKEIRLGGGGARNPQWNQIRANILNRPVLAAKTEQIGLMGALAIARQGNIHIAKRVNTGDMFDLYQPDIAQCKFYDRLYHLFQESFPAIEQISHALAEISNEVTEHKRACA